MDKFDLDDPLGDLLSDGSDDSFFNEPKPQNKSKTTLKSPNKKSVSDVFKLEDKTKVEQPQVDKDDWLGLGPKKSVSTPKLQKPIKKISFDDDDTDILDVLSMEGKSKSEPKIDIKRQEPSRKSTIMDDILGPPKEDNKKFLSLDDLLKDSKASSKKPEPTSELSKPTQLNENKSTTSILDLPRESRRARSRGSNIADPLGLLEPKSVEPEPKPRRRESPSTEITAKDPPTDILLPPPQEKENKTTSDVPGWLNGSQVPQKPVAETPIISAPQDKNIEETIQLTKSVENLVAQQKLNTSHIEYQNTSIALQQQESQLLMALQLKKYEDNMHDIQRKQQDVLIKQEQQFNNLLDRQFAKQQVIENNMRLQQERINNHIQMLIAQPPISSAASAEELQKVDYLKKSSFDEITQQYEEIISNIKQRQHDEIFLLEESYKKQVSTLEQSLESIENHLKMEIDSLNHKYQDKLNSQNDEHANEIDKYKNKIIELHRMHETEMKQMRENNNRVIEEIKYEYNTIIENLKTSKNVEQSVLNDASSYTKQLSANLTLLDLNSRSLAELHDQVKSGSSVLSQAREESVRIKQREIEDMRQALDKARAAADEERAQLMSLVRNLELKLSDQIQNSREERLALQQAAATLAARTSAIDREADYNRQSLEREREQLNVLRESILADQEKAMHEITEEKLKLHSEKVRLETSAKLTQNYDAQKAKAEVETAIQIAKEAAEMTDRERENLLKQSREVEALKRTLLDRERRVANKERDLEVAMEHANRRNLLGEKALEESRLLQINYNDKLREIQAQISSINMRERKLAEDKIAISKERLALHNSAQQVRKCGLCVVENQSSFIDDDNLSEHVEQDIPKFITASDADMFRLQLQLSEDQLTTDHLGAIHTVRR